MIYQTHSIASAIVAYMNYSVDSRVTFFVNEYVNGRETGYQVVPVSCNDQTAEKNWNSRSVIVTFDSRTDMLYVYCMKDHNHSLNRSPNYDDTRRAVKTMTFQRIEAGLAAEKAVFFIFNGEGL